MLRREWAEISLVQKIVVEIKQIIIFKVKSVMAHRKNLYEIYPVKVSQHTHRHKTLDVTLHSISDMH
ncbi:hypothetical protein GLOIN_2v1776461 [Rhizophagus clarus]|uniref:Uncharacterized protein n=1 Tax=Rhizophagus clarus TaxID=94130 RepID=A0A8H3M8H2_9GLOM|nr:hypothetical protein GLOIN_2v1776461 [Rhizophagus clarus]